MGCGSISGLIYAGRAPADPNDFRDFSPYSPVGI